MTLDDDNGNNIILDTKRHYGENSFSKNDGLSVGKRYLREKAA